MHRRWPACERVGPGVYARGTPDSLAFAPAPATAVDGRVLDAELDRLARTPVAATEKGFAALGPVTPAELAERRPLLHELGLTTPYPALDTAALAANLAAMAAYCEEHGVVIAPHAKTTMSPEVWAAHLRAGAWGLTAATPHHVAVLRSFGVRRIVYANEVGDAATSRFLARQLDDDPTVELCCYVDSLSGVATLDTALAARHDGGGRGAGGRGGPVRRLPVLVELGYEGGRGGARDVATALEVARAVRASRALRLAGAGAFEGTIGHGAPLAATLVEVRRFVRRLRRLGEAMLEAGLAEGGMSEGGMSEGGGTEVGETEGGTGGGRHRGPLVLSAGGSCFFDVVTEELAGGWDAGEVLVVLRAGGYACHDHGMLARLSPFVRGGAGGGARPALTVFSRVLSRPEGGRALVDAGRRDCSTDADLPVVIAVHRDGVPRPFAGLSVTACNDQHGYVAVAAGAELAAGDLVSLGVSHCCTTFDKWRLIPLVDADERVCGVAHTYF